ncbi:hypothetical protein [Streptomyces coeruleorubidus]|uniref:Restriction endonuclease type IV Mrr domain-containing protein n=1 Tax=Streptomyces coeruleorubidus TaxID=116188 RepID=A0ABZ0K5J9_STRC4|nr:hypothetical protein [Streptomyces coeruleorubidus]WOT33252.1 hypothetical protein R5U08_03430 [Streptomyces coeruleorubidus]
MAESVPVRCPSCRREHRFTAPTYPCACGVAVALRLDPDGTVTPIAHRVWQDDWVTVRCASCGRRGEWPRPEVGCACGVVLRVPVAEGREVAGRDGSTGQDTAADGGLGPDRDITVGADAEAVGRDGAPSAGGTTGPRDAAAAAERAAASADASAAPAPAAAGAAADAGTGAVGAADAAAGAGSSTGTADTAARPPFRSVTIRTALDAVTAAALYLRWLGYRRVRRADQRPPSGIGLAARGVVALVDPAVRPATLRDVECLWLTAMTESADCLYFSLVGYVDDARARADALGIPLFVLDLTGTPRPVNSPADALDATGTENRAP